MFIRALTPSKTAPALALFKSSFSSGIEAFWKKNVWQNSFSYFQEQGKMSNAHCALVYLTW